VSKDPALMIAHSSLYRPRPASPFPVAIATPVIVSALVVMLSCVAILTECSCHTPPKFQRSQLYRGRHLGLLDLSTICASTGFFPWLHKWKCNGSRFLQSQLFKASISAGGRLEYLLFPKRRGMLAFVLHIRE
jgi:hypothetical protein